MVVAFYQRNGRHKKIKWLKIESMDLTQIFSDWTRSGEDLLKAISKLLAVVGAFRIGYLYHIGRDRKMIFEELLHWIGAIIFFSSAMTMYEKVTSFFSSL